MTTSVYPSKLEADKNQTTTSKIDKTLVIFDLRCEKKVPVYICEQEILRSLCMLHSLISLSFLHILTVFLRL